MSFTSGGTPASHIINRREWLRVGGLGSMGLTLADVLRSQASAREKSPAAVRPLFGRAKSCIVVFLFGGPAHQDIWDLKPHSPLEVRGEFQPIATKVPGLFLGEHVPRLAGLADQYTLVRSVTHPDNTHTVAMHYMLTGVRHARPLTNPQNAADDFPCYGAAINYLAGKESVDASRGKLLERKTLRDLAPAVSLNAPANQVSANNHIFPGFFSGFLGPAHEPLFVSQHADRPDFRPLPEVLASGRLLPRRELLLNLEKQIAEEKFSREGPLLLDRHYQRAFELLTSTEARRAFQLADEKAEVRSRYGMTPFGQGCLLARRLVEAGVRLVTVNWERDDAYWDTHKNNFVDLKTKLLPSFDRGFATLLEDLRERGLLDETLVIVLSEFGRTPLINKQAGRDHWAACNTVLLAGAGFPGGYVHGASDRSAAYPTRDPVLPEDLSATVYHRLGIDARKVTLTFQQRSYPLSVGRPLLF